MKSEDKKSDKNTLITSLRIFARIIISLYAVLFFIFALLSGAEEYGGGITGIIKNSPNALPWLVLLGIIYVAWKWEFIGGLLITGMGLLTVFFFNVFKHHFALFAISLPLIILGGLFVLVWYLERKKI